MESEELDRQTGYRPDFKYHDENVRMLSWYVDRMIRAVRAHGATSLLSLGIGHQVVSRTIIAELRDLETYTIVEGSLARIGEFRAQTDIPASVRLEHSLFEDYAPPGELDAIEMGFVLEHVEDPLLILRRYASFLKKGGVMVVVVPNARALHRLVGHHAGLLPDLYALSPQDLELGHRRYFDLDAIQSLVREAGLTVRATEGIFLKCMSSAQLEALRLSPSIQEAFFQVGVAYPEICNAIYLETGR